VDKRKQKWSRKSTGTNVPIVTATETAMTLGIGERKVKETRTVLDHADEQAKQEVLELDEARLRTYASISGRFKLLLRNNNLSWNHHYEVSSIKQTEIADRKISGG
jgi:hypothetical protein